MIYSIITWRAVGILEYITRKFCIITTWWFVVYAFCALCFGINTHNTIIANGAFDIFNAGHSFAPFFLKAVSVTLNNQQPFVFCASKTMLMVDIMVVDASVC